MFWRNRLVIKPFISEQVTSENDVVDLCRTLEYYFSIVMGEKNKKKKDHNNGILIYHNGTLLGLLKKKGTHSLLSFSCGTNPVSEMEELNIYALERKVWNKLVERYLVGGKAYPLITGERTNKIEDVLISEHRLLRVNFLGKMTLHHTKVKGAEQGRIYDGEATQRQMKRRVTRKSWAPLVLTNDEMKRQRDVLIGYLNEERKKAKDDELFFDYIIQL